MVITVVLIVKIQMLDPNKKDNSGKVGYLWIASSFKDTSPNNDPPYGP